MHEERRRSRRLPVLGEHQQAILRVGDALRPVRLVDHSATGFAIVAEEHPGVFPGEVLWLKAHDCWTEVRVVKVRRDLDGTRVGLERLSDLALPPPDRVRNENWLSDDPTQVAPSPPSTLLLIGMAAVLFGVVISLTWTAVAKRLATLAPHPAARADTRPAAVRAIEDLASRKRTELEQTVQNLGAVILTLPDVSEHLRLSREQRRQIEEVVTAAAAAEQRLLQQVPAENRHERAVQTELVRSQALAQAMSVLDDEQRAAWNAMVAAAIEKLASPPQPAPTSP